MRVPHCEGTGLFAGKPAPKGTALTFAFCSGCCSCRGVKISKSCALPVGAGSPANTGKAGAIQRAVSSCRPDLGRIASTRCGSFQQTSSVAGAVRDSRSISVGHCTFGAKQCMWLRPSSSFQSRGGCTNLGRASGPCCMKSRAMAQ